MNSLFTIIRDKHALWYKGIVFLFSVVICALLLPNNQYESLKFIKVGDVWKSENLISEIDFLIQKTNNELKLQQNNIANFHLYFDKININTNDVLNQPLLDSKTKNLLKIKLDSVYQIGYYLNSKEYMKAMDSIFIVHSNEAKLESVSNLIEQETLMVMIKDIIPDTVILNQFMSSIPENILYNESLSKNFNSNSDIQESIYKNKISKGETLIRKNDVINKESYEVLMNYKRELDTLNKNTFSITVFIGKLMICALILGILMLFLAFFRKNIFSLNTQVTFIFLIIILFVLAFSTIVKYDQNYIFSIPLCLVPILIRVFFDSRTGLFNFLNIVLLCSFFTTDKFEFVFVQLIAGIGTMFSVAEMGKRSKLLVASLLIFVFYVLAFVAYHLFNHTELVLQNVENYYPFLISSLGVLFAFPLIYLFEKIFGFVSDFTLLELCDLNNPLLRQLSQKIPGTFQHSLQVANLAEEACYIIGGNALLVRTGAMYHDIGKINNPRFFTENQVGEVSPHQDISSEESAKIIINHVISGIEKAKEYKLPESIIDFIRTHHGTTTTRFFLHNYKQAHAGELINEDLFRYPGPIPFSKETAVLMMADSVEASSRSLKTYDAVTINDLVDRIIDYQISENQFINADITFRDINQIKKILKKRLMNIYHVRIEYPR
ncbi:MAG: HD family phosphohydrolase [Bacteroidota bacterium]